MGLFSAKLTDERVKELFLAVGEAADSEQAWKLAAPLFHAQEKTPRAAEALLALLEADRFGREHGLEVATAVFAGHGDDVEMVAALAFGLAALVDNDFLNRAPPEEDIFERILERLLELGDADYPARLAGLAQGARVVGRAWDQVAESAARRRCELAPTSWERQYDLGLFYKTRGRFAEGQLANQRAWDLGGADDEAVRWNLGICATGAGDAETALRIWKLLGQKIEMGRFDLPEGGYPASKVRLAERPLAERSADADDPGAEETIWIERLSPCHGIVRSALLADEIGVDYGDVVLIDGAPITTHVVQGQRVPVFPHLATLRRRGYRIHRFVGTQAASGLLQEVSSRLPHDAVVYVHDEQVVHTCAECWKAGESGNGHGHAKHKHAAKEEHTVVSGKLCAPPEVSAAELRAALDEACGDGMRVFAPDLAAEAGDAARAEFERRRAEMLREA